MVTTLTMINQHCAAYQTDGINRMIELCEWVGLSELISYADGEPHLSSFDCKLC